MQQVCPTCRAEIPAETVPFVPPPANAPPTAQPAPQASDRQAAAPTAAPVASTSPSSTPAASASTAAAVPAATPTGGSTPPPPVVVQPATIKASTGAHPAVHEIMDALKRAEEIAKFLGQQTDFWMDQVRQIEKVHTQQPMSSSPGADSCGLASQSQHWSFLSTNSAAASATGAAAVAEAVAAATPGSSSTAAEVPSDAASSSADLQGQMAKLRRTRQEQWERKRSSMMSSVSEAS